MEIKKTQPRTYRAMFPDKSAATRPQVGTGRNELGARVPTDIKPDQNGEVHPGKKGMSVVPSPQNLPPFLIPSRLQARYRNAAGDDATSIFSFGEAGFQAGPLTDELALSLTSNMHGVVSPSASMPLGQYQTALASTQSEWRIDE